VGQYRARSRWPAIGVVPRTKNKQNAHRILNENCIGEGQGFALAALLTPRNLNGRFGMIDFAMAIWLTFRKQNCREPNGVDLGDFEGRNSR
jgi:hypothetical protein